MNSILNRYIFTELIYPFAVCLTFLTSMFIMTRIPSITNMVVNYDANIYTVLMLMLFAVPRFMEFTLPLSVMISVLLTLMRMNGDNELIALKGGGVSLYRIVPPVLIFSILGTIITLWITLWAVPWGRFSFTAKGAELAQATLKVSLKERQFNSIFDDVMIYVTSIDINSSELSDIFIEDARDPNTVNITVASKGILVTADSGLHYTLRLSDGLINQVNLSEKTVNAVNFDTYDINFDTGLAGSGNSNRSKEFDEMYINELIDFIKKGNSEPGVLTSAKIELHEKFALPFACIALGLLSIPLGARTHSSRRSSGFGLAISFFLGYYLLLAVGWSAGKTGYYPPAIGMWMPNIVIIISALYLFFCVLKERSLSLPVFKRPLLKIWQKFQSGGS